MPHPRWNRLAALGLALILLAGALISPASAAAPTYESTILFTHDTHDHFLPMPDADGGESGGYTRLATLIKQEREAHPDALVLDGGDFSMGSLFQTIYAAEAPELRALGAMGYDVTTLGNHEFDYRSEGLADMLNAAVDSGDPLPAIVQANCLLPESDSLTEAWNRYGIGDYMILERGGVNYGIFGLMGEVADSNAPMSGVEFEPIADAARRTVAALEEELSGRNEPYFIICLSHSGTDGRGKGEDYQLARQVDGIDLIISGHTHTTLTVYGDVLPGAVCRAHPGGGHPDRLRRGLYRQPGLHHHLLEPQRGQGDPGLPPDPCGRDSGGGSRDDGAGEHLPAPGGGTVSGRLRRGL